MGQKLENLTKLILPQKPSFASVLKKKLTYFIICLNILRKPNDSFIILVIEMLYLIYIIYFTQ